MSLDWIDKVDGDDIDPNDLNRIAKSVKNLEKNKANDTDVYKKSDVEKNGRLDVEGDVYAKGEKLLDNSDLKRHSGIDIGAKGEGIGAVKFNSDDNEATGYKSLAGGAKNKVSGAQGVAFGYGNNNGGQNSFVMGYDNEIEDDAPDASMAVGISNKVKNRGMAFGRGLRTSPRDSGRMQIVVGTYNEEEPNAVFILGCGKTSDLPKNAIVVYDDGAVKLREILGDLVVSGNVIAENTYPQEMLFEVSGDDITNESGQTVAVFGKYNGAYQFNFSVRGTDGLLIKECTELNVPVLETFLSRGTYSGIDLFVSGSTMNTYLSACGYVAEFPEEISDKIVEIDGGFQVVEDVVVNEIVLKTTAEKIAETKYKNYRFSGKSKIETSVQMETDLIPEKIGAVRECIQSDGISTGLKLKSPDGSVFVLTVTNDGNLKATKI